ncbi:MAG: NADH-quinone oxidoreductase subunit D [Deltaproteobacteria bacterium]|nr:NADH-quinone oxidoreductase subunit D [Deltaproteobacteria bacterium]
MEDADIREEELELPAEPMTLNLGPSHPAMHGTIRIVAKLDGEVVVSADVQPGYLHRGFDKMAERGTWSQVFPYTDRLNYVSPILNNVGYALAVEKLLGITVPERNQYIRVVLGEFSRITDHLTNLGAVAMDVGAMTPLLWLLKAREWIWEILEEVTGARLTHSYVRIGGLAFDLTDTFRDRALALLPRIAEELDRSLDLLLENRIFIDRLKGVGVLPAAEAISYGVTGPMLRASGVDHDLRKTAPYLVYDRIDFDVPVGEVGDNWDRFMVRAEEVRQSSRIIRQALDQMPPAGSPIDVLDTRVILPPKEDVYATIEGTINHFKLVMEGIRVPAGEAYGYTEACNGELGFGVVSDGTGTPYRVRARGPCFANLAALGRMVVGMMIPDLIPTFGLVNMIAGECDR